MEDEATREAPGSTLLLGNSNGVPYFVLWTLVSDETSGRTEDVRQWEFTVLTTNDVEPVPRVRNGWLVTLGRAGDVVAPNGETCPPRNNLIGGYCINCCCIGVVDTPLPDMGT